MRARRAPGSGTEFGRRTVGHSRGQAGLLSWGLDCNHPLQPARPVCMDRPRAVVCFPTTADLIEACRAKVRDSRHAGPRMAAALGEAIGPRALARRNAHFLREEAFCSRPCGHRASHAPLVSSSSGGARSWSRHVIRPWLVAAEPVDTAGLALEPSLKRFIREHSGVLCLLEVSWFRGRPMAAEVSEELQMQVPLSRTGEALHLFPQLQR